MLNNHGPHGVSFPFVSYLRHLPLRKCAAVNDICEIQVMAMTAIAMTSFRAPRDCFFFSQAWTFFPNVFTESWVMLGWGNSARVWWPNVANINLILIDKRCFNNISFQRCFCAI